MPVKLKDIKGCLLKKETRHLNSKGNFNFGFNSYIDQQGNVSISLNRDKLIQLFEEKFRMVEGITVCEGDEEYEHYISFDDLADAIISKEQDILEVRQ